MRPSVVSVEIHPTDRWADQLEEFLRDPIGYGDYDASDPITLEDYVRPMIHRPFAALL